MSSYACPFLITIKFYCLTFVFVQLCLLHTSVTNCVSAAADIKTVNRTFYFLCCFVSFAVCCLQILYIFFLFLYFMHTIINCIHCTNTDVLICHTNSYSTYTPFTLLLEGRLLAASLVGQPLPHSRRKNCCFLSKNKNKCGVTSYMAATSAACQLFYDAKDMLLPLEFQSFKMRFNVCTHAHTSAHMYILYKFVYNLFCKYVFLPSFIFSTCSFEY